MKKRYMLLLLTAATVFYCPLKAQLPEDEHQIYFPEITFANIPGAPKLSHPVLVGNWQETIKGAGGSYAAPAYWDMNKDGKKDLLIGEFFSGGESSIGQVTGSLIRVFFNQGTAAKPEFGDFRYATAMGNFAMSLERDTVLRNKLKHLTDYGTPISVPTYCCMPFIPQFADLNGDGYADLYSGTYTDGDVYWFRGGLNGFWQGERLPQYGHTYGRRKSTTRDPEDIETFGYWVYSAVAFTPLKKDGLLDMIVGGLALRTSPNTGTRKEPAFGKRQLLRDTEGNPIWQRSEGVAIPHVVDWNRDGTPDLLFTSSNNLDSMKAVYFCKGVWQRNELKFAPPIPLFDIPSEQKSFPGKHPIIYVEDVNDDGIPDLLLGTMLFSEDGVVFEDKKNWVNDFSKNQPKFGGGYSPYMKKQIDRELKNAQLLVDSIGESAALALQQKDKTNEDKFLTPKQVLYKYYNEEKKNNRRSEGRLFVFYGKD